MLFSKTKNMRKILNGLGVLLLALGSVVALTALRTEKTYAQNPPQKVRVNYEVNPNGTLKVFDKDNQEVANGGEVEANSTISIEMLPNATGKNASILVNNEEIVTAADLGKTKFAYEVKTSDLVIEGYVSMSKTLKIEFAAADDTQGTFQILNPKVQGANMVISGQSVNIGTPVYVLSTAEGGLQTKLS